MQALEQENPEVERVVSAPAARSRKAPVRPSRWQILHSAPAMKAVRLATFVGVIGLVGVGLTYSRVRGQVSRHMLEFGEALMRYEHAERQDAPRELRLNGQSIMLTSGTTTDSLDAVLDEFERRCRLHNDALASQIRLPTAQDLFVVRTEERNVGTVGCLDFGSSISVADLLARTRRFSETNDLHDLGDLRYVYARSTHSGDAVHFLTFWTVGSLDFDELTGNGGQDDVPGRDPVDIPRPPRSRRVLDAAERGATERVVVYMGSSMTSWELEAWYRRELPRAGYRLVDDPRARDSTDGRIMIGLERDDRLTILVLGNDERGLGTLAVLAHE